jgi:GT2 family glycosyltransferase
MVTYGARDWVARALDALAANTPADRIELVVVDNASTDGTEALVRDYATRAPFPVQLECSPRNLGFAAGNDLAVNLARGSVVCLLNSDALVPIGWLDGLLAPVLADPTIGATLPLFVDVEGRLQEAGANVEPDGRVEAFGIRAGADDVEWSWPRRVTYGSAACWMLRTATFRMLGGFDAGYGIGYYEDADLAFEMARRGLRLELVPSVRVTHAQGASSPSSAVAVAQRDANQARFVERQRPLLAHRWHTRDLPNEPHRYVAARDVDVPERVLVVVGATATALDRLDERIRAPRAPGAPGRRITAVAAPGVLDDRAHALRGAGIEVVADPERVVRDRLFQLDEVRAPTAWLDAHADLLADHQPQARRVALDG